MLVQLYGVLQVYVKLRNVYNCEQKVVHSDTSYHIPNISGYGDFINLIKSCVKKLEMDLSGNLSNLAFKFTLVKIAF